MKKYRLKKDLPTVRAGEVFVRKTNETAQTDMLYHVDSEDVFLPPSIEVDDIHNFDEWFEEVKEFEEWKPKEDEVCKRIGITCGVYVETFSADDLVHEFRLSIGGLYPLDTPDEVIIKEQKLIPQAMHRLKMAAKKAWLEFNGSEGPDWKSAIQDKYYIYYGRSSTGGVDIVYTHTAQVFGCVYFPTEESTQAYIDNNKDDLKLLFGVE